MCDYLFHSDHGLLSLAEEFDPEVQFRKKVTYDIQISNKLFYHKIGQHKELMNILMKLGFKKELENKSGMLYLRLEKNDENYRCVKDAVSLLKMVAQLNTA